MVKETATKDNKTPSPEPAKAAPAKPGPKPKTGTDKTAAVDQAKMVAAARNAILKGTGQKQIGENRKPLASVPSGSSCIDDMIGGTLSADKSGPKCPGYPRRHITEIYGPESSGKTTLALEAISEVQRLGGIAMFIDFEHALDHQYAQRVGVSFDQDKLMLYAPETMEQGWKMIFIGIAGGIDLIVVDSVAAMVPEAEYKKKPGEPPKIGAVAASMSENLKKICVWLNGPVSKNPRGGTALLMLNQIRSTISSGGGGKPPANDNTAGGNALKFYAYVRLKASRTGSEIIKRKNRFTGKEQSYPYGNHTRVKLVKSKVDGKQGFTTDIFIRFNHGVDDFYSMIEAGVTTGNVEKEGAYFEYEGQRFQGRDKFRAYLMDNPKVFNGLRAKVLAMVRNEDDIQDKDLNEEDELVAQMENEFPDSDSSESTPEELEVEADDAETPEDSEVEEAGT